jgi:hypothetical protein
MKQIKYSMNGSNLSRCRQLDGSAAVEVVPIALVVSGEKFTAMNGSSSAQKATL